MISRDEILMGRDKQYPLNKDQEANLAVLLDRINKVRAKYGKPMLVSSGYRPAAINAKVAGAAKMSSHTLCMAVDIRDLNGEVRNWVLSNLDFLQSVGLWIEDFRWTPTWCHFQIRPASKRIFLAYDPKKVPMTAPDIWDGKYDTKFDKVL
jgi:hypothetical protein